MTKEMIMPRAVGHKFSPSSQRAEAGRPVGIQSQVSNVNPRPARATW